MSEARHIDSGSGWLVRPADWADDEGLRELSVRTWSTLHAVTPPPEEGAPFLSFQDPPERYQVAEDHGGRLLGYVCLGWPTGLASNAHVRQIRGLEVDRAARGRGVGRALVRSAIEGARLSGARRLTLRVLGHNRPARTLYESLGFRVEGVLPGEFHLAGEYVDDVLMGRSLLP
ncbi:GNAT family N-acetyltransferase [Streptomyces sp. NPDC005438]|uniref:GNAT family N-acetyltransferase n=1 Tax=Streptomyces sp. NPDC005438 TaxID=3156880 RepID=UPI0033A52D3F